MDKDHGKDIPKLVTLFLKDESKIPQVILSQDQERKFLEDNASILEKEFNAKVHIATAEDTKESKGSQALPGKPAIVLK